VIKDRQIPQKQEIEEKVEDLEMEVEKEEIVQVEEVKIAKKGKVSYYSHSGCLGCDQNQITASGEPFNENEMTLAIPAEWRGEIPMGTMVKVINLDNGKSRVAKVNDTGGFLKYNRIADLSLALYKAIEAKTDQSIISLEVI
jgi:rare lipoprotein A